MPMENIRSRSWREYTRNAIKVSELAMPGTARILSVTTFAS